MKLEREAIVDAAIKLLDEVGLDGLSMRRLAKDLDVQAPALYWHFKNKQELLDHMLVAMSTEELRVPRPGQPWDEWLVERTTRLYRGLGEHRDAARLAASTRPTPDLLPGIEAMVSALTTAGFTPAESLHSILAISNFVTGSALEREGTREHGDGAIPDVTPFPLLRTATASGLDPDVVFDHGLRILVGGMRAILTERGHYGQNV
ncbi:TetR/AcrR family transcriptional regulator C-terminal domain-containing protein [Catenulispora yoronensis]|uniref:TetR/AcrR family transcriptional regulator C-terminal domain-containing protein n=1 Tax=Catenulispora yoronensis TaxID=450799 RepID=A0ABP5FVK5_9ACTN